MSIIITAYLDGGKTELGYKFIVTQSCTSWKAFKTTKGFKYFLDGYGLKINAAKTQLHDCRATGHGRFITMVCFPKKINEISFWEISEVPQEARPFYSVVNGNYVQCYIWDKKSEVVLYEPNPNAPMVYVPFEYQTMRNLIG